MLCRVSLSVLLYMVVPAAAGQVFAGIGREGTLMLSNFSTPETPALVAGRVETAPVSPAATNGLAPRALHRFKQLVDTAAERHGLDPKLLHAVVGVESNYDPAALSVKGARGLMQLMPATARRFGVADPNDVVQNLDAGARYLRWLLEFFNGNLELALAGYNAGENAVVHAGYRVPPYSETVRYVPKVMSQYRNSGG